MGGACGTNEGQEIHMEFHWQNLNVRDHLEDPGINGSPFSPFMC